MPCSKTNGASKIIEEGEKLFSNAKAYINGLNAEPGCLSACVALLNSLFIKLKPPEIA